MSVKKFLDEVGLGHTWSKIKSLLNGKADTDLNNVTNDNFRDKAIDAGVGGVPIVVATSTDGVTYSGSANGITTLKNGVQVVFIPNKKSTNVSAIFNLNKLGAKYIRQSLTSSTITTVTPANANWLAANKPVLLEYDGEVWKTVAARANASDIYGTLAISKGGTGATTAKAALTALGIDGAITGLSVSGKVITYTRKNGTTGTITTQDTYTLTKLKVW